jgi:hypothetical protein
MGDYLHNLYNAYKSLTSPKKEDDDSSKLVSPLAQTPLPSPAPAPGEDDSAPTVKADKNDDSTGGWLSSFFSKKQDDNQPVEASFHPLSAKPEVDVKPDLMKEDLDPRTLQTPMSGEQQLTDHNPITDPGLMSKAPPHVPTSVENMLASLGNTPVPMPTQGPMSPVPPGGLDMGAAAPHAPAMASGAGLPGPAIDVGHNSLGDLQNLRDAQAAANQSEFTNRLLKSLDIASAGIARTNPSGQEFFDQGIKNSQQVVKDYQQQLANQKYDPNSTESKAFREYAKQLGVPIKGDLSAADAEHLYPLIFKNYELKQSLASKEKMNREDIASREKIAKMNLEGKKDVQGQKMTDKDNADFEKAVKTVNQDLASSRSAFGRNANVVRAAGALKQLVADTPNMNNWTESQVNEFAKNLDAMLSNGAGTVSGMKSFIPHSFMGSIKKLGSKAFNRPLGMDQGAFAQNLMNMVNAEEAYAKQGVQKTKGELLRGYEHLAAKYPDRWNRTFGEIGLDADSILNKPSSPAGAGMHPAPGQTPPGSTTPQGMVTIRSKVTGKTKLATPEQAQAFLKSPDFEQVQM